MFKVGDLVKARVTRIHGLDIGVTYKISDVDGQIYQLEGKSGWYSEGCFILDTKNVTPLAIQHGGTHYKKLKIQPVEYIMANGIPYMEGNVIKYVSRWKDKGGIEDLKKAKHYLEILIENEQKNVPTA